MTLTSDRSSVRHDGVDASPGRTTLPPPREPAPAAVPAGRSSPVRATALLTALWLVVLLLAGSVAATALGGLAETRAQHTLLATFRQDVSFAEAATRSVLGGTAAPALPAPGSGVALLQVPRLGLQRVVVEGATSGDTQRGPGHVAGTAGVGQPGNAAVVGRRTGYGAAFRRLGEMRPGDAVVVTTVQGQSVYRVTDVRHTGSDVLAPSQDDRLTLLTAGGWSPLQWRTPLVVTARLEGKPFPPTPQATRSAAGDGGSGDPAATPTVILRGLALLLGGALTVLLYRRWSVRSTYVLTTPALVALVVLTTDAALRLLPAWV